MKRNRMLQIKLLTAVTRRNNQNAIRIRFCAFSQFGSDERYDFIGRPLNQNLNSVKMCKFVRIHIEKWRSVPLVPALKLRCAPNEHVNSVSFDYIRSLILSEFDRFGSVRSMACVFVFFSFHFGSVQFGSHCSNRQYSRAQLICDSVLLCLQEFSLCVVHFSFVLLFILFVCLFDACFAFIFASKITNIVGGKEEHRQRQRDKEIV